MVQINKDNFGKGKSMLITDTIFLEQSLLFYQPFFMGKFWPLLFWENFENSTTTPPPFLQRQESTYENCIEKNCILS